MDFGSTCTGWGNAHILSADLLFCSCSHSKRRILALENRQLSLCFETAVAVPLPTPRALAVSAHCHQQSPRGPASPRLLCPRTNTDSLLSLLTSLLPSLHLSIPPFLPPGTSRTPGRQAERTPSPVTPQSICCRLVFFSLFLECLFSANAPREGAVSDICCCCFSPPVKIKLIEHAHLIM